MAHCNGQLSLGHDAPEGEALPRPRQFRVVLRSANFHHRRMSNMTSDEIRLYLDTARAEAKASASEVARSQAELRAELKASVAAISVDVHATSAAHTKWTAALGFGVIASVTAIVGMFKATSPAEPVPRQAPPPAPYAVDAQTAETASRSTPPLPLHPSTIKHR